MGLDEGRLLLAVELGAQRQIQVDEVRRGGVVGPRPRAFVVGEEALVRRCWGWRRAAALVVAEHAALPSSGVCLWLLGGVCPRGQPFPAMERAPGRAMRRRKRALRPGPGRCALLPVLPRAPGACPGWAPCGRGRDGSRGDASAAPRRLPRAVPRGLAVQATGYGFLVAAPNAAL